jgi:hypothetical protein
MSSQTDRGTQLLAFYEVSKRFGGAKAAVLRRGERRTCSSRITVIATRANPERAEAPATTHLLKKHKFRAVDVSDANENCSNVKAFWASD